MRRLALLAPIAVLAGALVAVRRRRARRASAPLAAPAPPAAVALLPAGERFASVPWALAEAPADRPALTVRYAAAAGVELDRVDAQETPTQVFVTVLTRLAQAPPAPLGWQPERTASVALAQPLGARELVHAPVDLEAAPAPATAPPAGGGPSGPPLYP